MKSSCYFLFIFLANIFTSCNKESSNNNIIQERIPIDFSQPSKNNTSNLINKIHYIKLKEEVNKDFLISRIEKIIFQNNTLYISDGYIKKILSVDINGNVLKSYGKFGEGPGEFLSITDFYVDKNKTVYIYDSKKNKIHIYDSTGKFIKDNDIPFKAENIYQLENGKYLFSLAPYNDEDLKNAQLILTDHSYNITEKSIFFNKEIDPNFHINSTFTTTKDNIVYNRVIDYNVYLFSKEGNLKEIINFYFPNLNIPIDKMHNMNSLFNELSNYCFIATTPIVTNDYIYLNIRNCGDFYTCIYNRHNEDTEYHNINNIKADNLILPMYFLDENETIISYFNSDILPNYENANFPEDIAEHLKNGNIVIAMYELKDTKSMLH